MVNAMLNVSVKIKTVSIEPEFFKRGLAMLGNGLIKQIYFLIVWGTHKDQGIRFISYINVY